MRFLVFLPLLALSAPVCTAFEYPPQMEGAEAQVYRTVDGVELNAYVFEPGKEFEAPRPAIVFFFGGGWRNGSPAQFEQHCRYLASRGMVAITCDYRVLSRHGTPARECVVDAKAAIRWVRKNAKKLGIDPKRVAAGGGSAGGHLAACTAVIEGFEPADANPAISSRPNALVLFNPVLVLAPYPGNPKPLADRQAELAERMGVPPKQLSPFHHVGVKEPPTIVFHGEADTTVPLQTARAFATAMKKEGNRCELKIYKGESHGFFNYGRDENKAFLKTVAEADQFLQSLGWLKAPATVEAFFGK